MYGLKPVPFKLTTTRIPQQKAGLSSLKRFWFETRSLQDVVIRSAGVPRNLTVSTVNDQESFLPGPRQVCSMKKFVSAPRDVGSAEAKTFAQHAQPKSTEKG
jgi:hypothetical protein